MQKQSASDRAADRQLRAEQEDLLKQQKAERDTRQTALDKQRIAMIKGKYGGFGGMGAGGDAGAAQASDGTSSASLFSRITGR